MAGISVLVVDDSDINCAIAKKLLLAGGAAVHVSADGQSALDWLRLKAGAVDIVLMDIHMPIMDGLTAVRILRKELGLVHLPVIAMTSSDAPNEIEDALAAGMTGHLFKPFSYSSMLEVVNQFVRGSSTQPSHGTTAQADEDTWPRIDGISAEKSKLQFQGDVDFFLRQLRRLLLEFDFLAGDPPPPSSDEEWRALADHTHKLVGSAGLLCAAGLSSAARRCEELAKERNRAEIGMAINELGEVIKAVRSGSREYLHRRLDEPAKPMMDGRSSDERYAQWLEDLRLSRYRAVKDFPYMADRLRATLSAPQMLDVLGAIEHLDFDGVLAILQPRG